MNETASFEVSSKRKVKGRNVLQYQENQDHDNRELDGEKIEKVADFSFLRALVECEGRCERKEDNAGQSGNAMKRYGRTNTRVCRQKQEL